MPRIVREPGTISLTSLLPGTTATTAAALWLLTSPILIDPGYQTPIEVETATGAGTESAPAGGPVESTPGLAVATATTAATVESAAGAWVVGSTAAGASVVSSAGVDTSTQTQAGDVTSTAAASTESDPDVG